MNSIKLARKYADKRIPAVTLLKHWRTDVDYILIQEAFIAGARSRDEEIDSLFDAIKHGDYSHQRWLKEAIEKHFKKES